jgi:drug/metabolite transporter (DMT)-like permease
MYFGLTLTFASSFQMLRGAVMFFTAVLSVIFLKAIIQAFKWAGIGVVIVGLVGVGVSDMLKVS